MAFVYQVSFGIPRNQADELALGAPLERVLGYLRTRLPEQTGYVTARAMNSVDANQTTEVVVQSVWETWDDLLAHQKSQLAEAKVLLEFGSDVPADGLTVRVYEEVA